MGHWQNDFASFGNKIWLNAASEGPLPKVAATALQEAIHWKSLPYELSHARFQIVPLELKQSIGKLINVSERDVILGNSASYGLHILANGLPWKKGDQILCMQNDFPTNILPWLALEEKGVQVIQIPAHDRTLTPDELRANITPQTKLFCISHVHTFSGVTLDIKGLAKICKDKGIIFVLNISQSVGTMPIDLSKLDGVSAVVSAGYKWLCGPYGTGFAWIKPQVREQLNLNQAYWLSMLSEEDLKSEGPLVYKNLKSARKYDVFGTANFFNFVPFKAAIDFFLKAGLENAYAHQQKLIDQFIDGLDPQKYLLISPAKSKSRSSLVVFSHKDPQKNPTIFTTLLKNEIYPAFWKGNIRISPHVYNTSEEIQKLIKVLSK